MHFPLDFIATLSLTMMLHLHLTYDTYVLIINMDLAFREQKRLLVCIKHMNFIWILWPLSICCSLHRLPPKLVLLDLLDLTIIGSKKEKEFGSKRKCANVIGSVWEHSRIALATQVLDVIFHETHGCR